MMDFLQKLVMRKSEISSSGRSAWQRLVSDVLDGKEQDPDATLADLGRLGKTIDDLNEAVELLRQRRQWADEVAAGDKAEVEYPKLLAKLDAEEKVLADLMEAHERKIAPIVAQREAAKAAIARAADARRRLTDTATDPDALAAVSEAEAKLEEIRKDRAAVVTTQRAKSDRLAGILAQEDPDLQPKVDRLSADLETLKTMNFTEREQQVLAECDAARAKLETANAI